MDQRTRRTLELISSHYKIKTYLTIICYILIAGSLLGYAIIAFSKSNSIKLVNKYKEKNYNIEKIMINPRINLQYDDNSIYKIEAKKASHKNNEEVILFDVYAVGDIGNIKAGELEVKDSGDHLIFSKNPILILNKTK